MHPTRSMLWLAVMGCVLPAVLSAQALPFGISLPPALTFATSPNPVGSGARAAGKAFAFIGVADDATSVRLGAEYLWIRPQVVIPFRAGVFYDPEPGAGSPDHFFGFPL